MGKNIRIEELTPEQLVHGLLSSYSRRQEVTRVYRYVEGQRVVKDLYFVEDWDEKEKDDHVDEMIEVVSKGGNAFVIYVDEDIKGFALLADAFIGPEGTYLQLLEFHISSDVRGVSMGSQLFFAIKEKAGARGAKKLYISSHSAIETVGFYEKVGAVKALWRYERQVALEPCDLQLECVI